MLNSSLVAASIGLLALGLPSSVSQLTTAEGAVENRIGSLQIRVDSAFSEPLVAQSTASERYDRLSDRLVAELRQLHPDIVDVRGSASIALLDDGSEFITWSPAITLRSGLSLEQQQAITQQVAIWVAQFQRSSEGSLFPLTPTYSGYGSILLFVKYEDAASTPYVDNVSYRILGRDPVAVEVSLNINTDEGRESTVIGRIQAGEFIALDPDQPDPAVEAEELVALGQSQLDDGNWSAAQQSLEAAVNIYRDLPDNEQEFQALSRLITAYEKLGAAPNIKVALQRQAVLAEAMQDPLALRRVGIEFQCTEQWDAALATDQKALAIYRRNRPDEASPTNSFTVDMELATLANMSQTLIKANRFAEAEQTLLTALDLLDSVLAAPIPGLQVDDVELDEQISRFADYYTSPVSSNNLYLMLQRVFIAQGRTDEALVVAERGRTQALEEVWAIKQAGERLPDFALADIQAIARSQDATVVTYSFSTVVDRCTGDLASPELLTWVIQPTGDIHFHKQPIEFSAIATEPDDISNLVQGTRTSLGARGLTIVAANPESLSAPPVQDQPYLQLLNRLLIEPIESHLSANPNDHIIFVPDFVLFMAPFPALQDDEGRYLIEKHTLSSAPSIQALALTAQARQRSLPARANPLIVGNPIYAPISLLGRPPITLPPLPGAEQEALTIADLLGTEPLIRADATKQAILETIEDASLLHFATHGFLDGVALDTPGAIAVAQSQDDASVVLEYPNFIRYLSDDGLIRTQEILSFRLQANLVVLSACNTGGGELTGDGVTGLSRAFIAAGVPSVIVSLWAVPDAPTGELMATFYEEWLAGADKASALRLAMLDTLEKYPNPVNWAAFTLIGETQ